MIRIHYYANMSSYLLVGVLVWAASNSTAPSWASLFLHDMICVL